MASPTIRFKRGTQSALSAVGLGTGEPAFITDEFNFYIGTDSTVVGNKFFGSSRYWKQETTSVGGGVKLYGAHAVGTAGTAITLAAPDSLSSATTYTLPPTPIDSFILKTDSSGVLSWSNVLPAASFTGISTFTNTTDNTLGNPDTGAVQIDGGLGVNKNLTVGANLNVQGYSEFVGVVTFRGGTINLGDANTDDINVAGEFVSNLIPNTDAFYDIGSGSQRWRNASFSGIGSFSTGAVVDNIQIGISNANKIDTTSGNLLLDSTTGVVEVSGDLQVTGNDIKSSTGATAISLSGSDVTVAGNLYVSGSTTQINTTALTVEDRTLELGRVDGNLPTGTTTWDLGVLFNYYSGSAKKSAVLWEQADSRFKFASILGADSDGTTVDTPQLTVNTYASIEISSLWINNTCSGGAKEVIKCVGSELQLHDIVIDGGTF